MEEVPATLPANFAHEVQGQENTELRAQLQSGQGEEGERKHPRSLATSSLELGTVVLGWDKSVPLMGEFHSEWRLSSTTRKPVCVRIDSTPCLGDKTSRVRVEGSSSGRGIPPRPRVIRSGDNVSRSDIASRHERDQSDGERCAHRLLFPHREHEIKAVEVGLGPICAATFGATVAPRSQRGGGTSAHWQVELVFSQRVPRIPEQSGNNSPVNVPLMWAAAGDAPSTPALDWIIRACQGILEPVKVPYRQAMPANS